MVTQTVNGYFKLVRHRRTPCLDGEDCR
jgi:hypothetical protein